MKSEFDIGGQVVVITGGAGLLGCEFASAVAVNGGIAIIADIDEAAAKKRSDELKEKKSVSGVIDYKKMDITCAASIQTVIGSLSCKYGKIDALVNNAYPRNKNFGREFFSVTYNDFCENVNLNLGGYFLASQQFARFFMKQRSGNIINIASIYGIVPPRFDAYESVKFTMPVEYAATKAAVIHLTRYLAKLLKGSGVRVNALSPGGIMDGQPDEFVNVYNSFCLSKGMLNKEDLRGTFLYLLSEASLYLNGQNIIIDDGFVL